MSQNIPQSYDINLFTLIKLIQYEIWPLVSWYTDMILIKVQSFVEYRYAGLALDRCWFVTLLVWTPLTILSIRLSGSIIVDVGMSVGWRVWLLCQLKIEPTISSPQQVWDLSLFIQVLWIQKAMICSPSRGEDNGSFHFFKRTDIISAGQRTYHLFLSSYPQLLISIEWCGIARSHRRSSSSSSSIQTSTLQCIIFSSTVTG